MTTRRDFLKLTAAAGAAAVLPIGTAIAKTSEPEKVEVIKREVLYGTVSFKSYRAEHKVIPQVPGEPFYNFKDMIPKIRMKDGAIDNMEWLFDGIQWELEEDHNYPPASRLGRWKTCWLPKKDAVEDPHGIYYWGVVQVHKGTYLCGPQGNQHYCDIEPIILRIQDSNYWYYRHANQRPTNREPQLLP